MANLLSAKLSDVGRKRGNNEDYVTLFEPTDAKELQSGGCLYIIADGVGGASKGERASQYAADKVLYEYYQLTNLEPANRLRQAIIQVNQDIFSYAEQSERLTRMATTMVAAVIRGNVLLVANVGDSRAYLIRNGEATQITHDHSIVGEMMATGEMTEAEAQASKIKNRLTRSIGGEADVHVQVYDPIRLYSGDKILLCTDGLTRYALLPKITELTAQGSNPKEIAERLIQYANKRGGADNVSAIVVAFEPAGISEQPAIAIESRPRLPLSWDDDKETVQDVPQVAAAGVVRARSIQKRRRNDVALLLRALIITVLILSVAGLGMIIIPPYFGYYLFGTPTVSVPLMPLGIPTQTPKQTSTPQPTSKPALATPIFTTTTTPPLTVTPTFTVTATIRATSSPKVPTQLRICVVEATSSKYKGIIYYLTEFHLSYDPTQIYSHCVLDAGFTSCTTKIPLDSYQGAPIIRSGYWLVMPVASQEACSSPLGKWVTDESH